MNSNRKGFLHTISWSEGTDNGRQKTLHNGYDVIVGGSLFTDFSDHPRKLVKLNANLSSTAAGRYQLLARYFDPYKRQLGLKDFGPESQDRIALQQIKECRALEDIDEGDFDVAIKKCARIWASFPGAGYGQHEQKLEKLREVYVAAGGSLKGGTK